MKTSSLKSSTIVLALRQNGLSTLTAALRHWVHAILPLSSCSRSTRMFLRGIMCCALVVVLVSCKSASHIVGSTLSATEQSISRSTDTIYQHDSIFIREYLRGDTVYLTRTEYRDRWRIHEVHDTIMRTDSIVQVVEHPPERYVPKFYKISTLAFYLLLLVVCFIIFRKFW